MDCPDCQHSNPSEARFCNACGRSLEGGCGSCGHMNPAGSVFCNACGTNLAGGSQGRATPQPEAPTGAREPRSYTPGHLAERILRSRSALEGERKHVAVLFCDLVDSTRIARELGAETMHAVMDDCLQQILGCVHRFEGTVNQFLGDGVMALFGAPLALEDAPRRAVTAALEIQRELEPFAERVRAEHGVDFRMRIGVHCGPVVVGRIGDDLRMDYTAVGDTTNLADRLQGVAPAGSVVISEAAQQLVAGYFDLEDLGAVPVKGREPLRAYRVSAARQATDRVEAQADSELTPIVGREREREVLAAAYDSAKRGRGQVVFVVGEAGMGKTRLLHEFRRSLDPDSHVWFEGRCASHVQNAAFHALADGVRRDFGIGDRDDDTAALAKIASADAELPDDLTWTQPFVRRLLSLPSGSQEVDDLDPLTRRRQTFAALRDRLLAGGASAPLVLIIEDMHWVDPATSEFLGYLSESIAAAHALVILTQRPGYRHPFRDQSHHIRLAVQPLSRGEMDRMASAVLHSSDLPPAVRALVAGKAEGNPFFVEEVVQSLVEDGTLSNDGDRVRLQRDVEEV